MAASNRRDLFISIGGNIDKLENVMKAGRSVLLDFGITAGNVQAEVQKALSNFGANQLNGQLKSIEASYKSTFATIRSNAQAVLNAPSQDAAAAIINVNASREAVRASEARAAGLRLVANAAAASAAATQGDAAAARTFAVAAEAAAIEEERRTASLRTQLGVLAQVENQLGRLGQAQARSTTVSGAQRAGFQQLGFQMNDVAVQFAAGTPAMTIFAQQSGQVVQALQLMSGEAKGLLGFLGGPWGIILTTAVIALTPFVAKLFEGADAAKEAKSAANALGDAQSVLGGLFDLTTGKIKSQNEVLRLNARLMALNLKSQALSEEASAQRTFRDSQTASIGQQFKAYFSGSGLIRATLGDAKTQRNAKRAQTVIDNLRSGNLSPEDALRFSSGFDFGGLSISRQDFQQAILDQASAKNKSQISDLITKALDTGVLPSELKQYTRPKKTPVDRTAEREANRDAAFQNDLRQSNAAIARANQQLATSSQSRLDIALADIDDALERRTIELADKVTAKKISAAEAKLLVGKAEQLANVQRQAATERKAAEDREAAFRLESDERNFKIGQLDVQEQLADTLRERRAVQLQILDLEIEERRRALEKQKADAKDAVEKDRIQREIDRLPQIKAGETAKINRQNRTPAERLRDDLNPAKIAETIEEIKVRGLQNLEDGLVGVIEGTESVTGAFKKMAASIIADLARIAIQQAIIRPIANALFGGIGFSAGGLVQRNATGGLIRGAGSGTSDSILSWLSDGEFVMNAASTKRFLPILMAMNDNSVPGFAEGGLAGISGVPSLPSIPRFASRERVIRVEVDRSEYFDVTVRDISRQEATPIAVATVTRAAPTIVQTAQTQTIDAMSRQRLG